MAKKKPASPKVKTPKLMTVMDIAKPKPLTAGSKPKPVAKPISETPKGSPGSSDLTTTRASESNPAGGAGGSEGITAGHTAADAEGVLAESTRKESWAEATNRWTREGRRREADLFRETVRMECISRDMTRKDAKQHAWAATIAAFPVEGTLAVEIALPEPSKAKQPDPTPDPPKDSANGHLAGLESIPAVWPALPATASLTADLAWVQSNRLAVVEERPAGGQVVHLDRAAESAPSRSALGWLETSIRSYAKYIEVASRTLSAGDDDQHDARRERVAMDAIEGLLDEMHATI